MMQKRKNKSKKTTIPDKDKNHGRPSWVYQLIIFLFAFTLYGNTISNDYCIDDNLVVWKNVQVMKGVSGIPEIFTSHYREGKKNEYGYRPIAKAIFALESQFFSQNPHVSHLINVLLYGLLLLLLFQLLNKIFPDVPLSLRFIIILLYAAHPLHTEVVASLKNREELLCFIFGAAATIMFIKAFDEKGKKAIRIIVGILSLVLSVLSKQTGMVFCIVIPIILLQFYYKPLNYNKIINPGNKAVLKKYLWMMAFSVVIGLILVFFTVWKKFPGLLFIGIIPFLLFRLYRKNYSYKKDVDAVDKNKLWKYVILFLLTILILVLGYSSYKVPQALLPHGDKPLYGFENPLFIDHSLQSKISLGFMGLLDYFKLLFIPWPLSFYYGYNTVPLTGIGDYRVIISVIIHLALLFIAVYTFRRNKIISFGILFYLIGILMFTNWFTKIPGIIGERLMFVASFGFCMAIGGVLYLVWNRILKDRRMRPAGIQKYIYILMGLIILVFSVKTFSRNRAWKNHYTLYRTDIAHLQNSAKANSIYADELLNKIYDDLSQKKPYERSEVDDAFRHYKKAAEIYPDFFSAYTNMGTIYYTFYKNKDSAIYYFSKSLSIDSTNYEANYGIAMIYDLTGDTTNAIKYYEKSIKLDSSGTDALTQYANILFKKGELKKAIDLNMQISRNDTSSPAPFINIGNYYIMQKDTSSAIEYLEKASDLSSKDNKLNTFLANYYQRKGDNKKHNFYLKRIK